MIRLSLDTETLGTSAGSQILQIACVDLDNPSDFIDLRLNPVDQYRYGLTIDPATVDWWFNQSPAVRDSVFGGTLPLDVALTTFALWIKDIIGKEEAELEGYELYDGLKFIFYKDKNEKYCGKTLTVKGVGESIRFVANRGRPRKKRN